MEDTNKVKKVIRSIIEWPFVMKMLTFPAIASLFLIILSSKDVNVLPTLKQVITSLFS